MSFNSCEFFLNFMPKCILVIIHHHPSYDTLWVGPSVLTQVKKRNYLRCEKVMLPSHSAHFFFQLYLDQYFASVLCWHARGSSIMEQGMTVRSDMGRNASRNALSLQLSLWRAHQLQNLCPWSYMCYVHVPRGLLLSKAVIRGQNQTPWNMLIAAQTREKEQGGAQFSTWPPKGRVLKLRIKVDLSLGTSLCHHGPFCFPWALLFYEDCAKK